MRITNARNGKSLRKFGIQISIRRSIAMANAKGLVSAHKISMIHKRSSRIGKKKVYIDSIGVKLSSSFHITDSTSFIMSAFMLAFSVLNGNCILSKLNRSVRSGSWIGGRAIDNDGRAGTGIPGIDGRLKLEGESGAHGITYGPC